MGPQGHARALRQGRGEVGHDRRVDRAKVVAAHDGQVFQKSIGDQGREVVYVPLAESQRGDCQAFDWLSAGQVDDGRHKGGERKIAFQNAMHGFARLRQAFKLCGGLRRSVDDLEGSAISRAKRSAALQAQAGIRELCRIQSESGQRLQRLEVEIFQVVHHLGFHAPALR